MATNNALNNDIGVSVGTSLNLGASTTIDSVIDDDTMATATDSNCATSESIVAYIAAQIGVGAQVVQYVVSTSSTDDSSTSTSLAASSLSASITPTSASNRILVIACASTNFTTGSSAQNYLIKLDLYRSTGTPASLFNNPWQAGNIFSSARSNDYIQHINTLCGTEIAPDTNAHTYQLRFARFAASGTAQVLGASQGPAFMIILELLV
jgi:hypothetical protein